MQAIASVTDTGGTTTSDPHLVIASDFAPFNQSLSANASLPGNAASAFASVEQISSFEADAIVVSGSFVAQPQANAAGNSAQATGSSYIELTFDLLVPTTYTVTGSLNQTGAAALARLTGESGTVFLVLTFDGPVPVNQSGSLPPGRYTFDATAAGIADAGFQSPGDASGDMQIRFDVASSVASFCDGNDGALASCPCANPGSPDTGCDLGQATGGVGLDLVALETNPSNSATWVGTGFPTNGTPAAILIRSTAFEPAPVVFGDGVRCIAAPLVRLGGSFAFGGTSNHTHGHGPETGPFHYQLWFRNQPAAFCNPEAFNLSNGRTVVW